MKAANGPRGPDSRPNGPQERELGDLFRPDRLIINPLGSFDRAYSAQPLVSAVAPASGPNSVGFDLQVMKRSRRFSFCPVLGGRQRGRPGVRDRDRDRHQTGIGRRDCGLKRRYERAAQHLLQPESVSVKLSGRAPRVLCLVGCVFLVLATTAFKHLQQARRSLARCCMTMPRVVSRRGRRRSSSSVAAQVRRGRA